MTSLCFSRSMLAALLGVTLVSLRAFADLTLTTAPGANDFLLTDGTNTAAVFAEPTENRAVTRAVGDLAEDIFRVTGVKAALAEKPAGRNIVLVGTLGASATIDRLAADGKLDVAGVRGGWESYTLQIVPQPLPGVDKALVIAGSDRRGTIYGIYQLSETIGVSPWYWWADVPAKTNKSLALTGSLKQGPPAVKYRGIFLNDEDWGLRPWAAKTFDTNTANIGPKTYGKIFELLLRLRANYLWPAMHQGTRAFNHYPTNKELADLYGIVMGSSHCEQMLRNNVDEWDTNKFGKYDYVTNRDGVLKYWEQRVQENGKYDNIYTMGMRGIHDGAMPGGGTTREKAARLHDIIKDQRELLARHVNTNVAAVPQIFCPYKEVLELYRLRPELPDDITLVWPDDNFGYVRQFSNDAERKRSGGAGVYYHVSYWGAPQDYLWLCSTPPALMAEEMTKAYAYGADRVWVLNVGDIKPAEVATEFFLRLAWNPLAWNGTNTSALLAQQFARDFGAANAPELASIMTEYYRLNFQRKPEHLVNTVSNHTVAAPIFSASLNGDETEQRLKAWQSLVRRLTAVEAKLSPDMEDCIFELAGYGIYISAIANERANAMNRFNTYREQGRAIASDYLSLATLANRSISNITENYNTKAATGGKWMHMFDAYPHTKPFHIPTNLPVAIGLHPHLGVVVEGSTNFYRTDLTNNPGTPQLPRLNKLTQRAYFVDVFKTASPKLNWRATPSADWIKLDTTNGSSDARVWVSVNWSNAPVGDDVQGAIRFTAGTNQEITVAVSAWNPADTTSAKGVEFVEDNALVAMEAEHASSISAGKHARWQPVTGLGYNGTAMTITPVTAPTLFKTDVIVAESPCLRYQFWVNTPGEWTFTVRSLPTFSTETGSPQRYAIAVDEATPQIVSLPAAMSEKDKTWQQNVLRNAALTQSKYSLTQAGPHTLKIWMVDPGIVLDTIFATTTGAPALGYVGPAETRNKLK